MFDVGWTEMVLVAFVALVVIGPKDLPKAMRVVGYWVGRARGVGRQFRSGFDAMVREAELEEMEKKWAEENARIMAMHPVTPAATAALPEPDDGNRTDGEPLPEAGPLMVEKPRVEAGETPPPLPDKAQS